MTDIELWKRISMMDLNPHKFQHGAHSFGDLIIPVRKKELWKSIRTSASKFEEEQHPISHHISAEEIEAENIDSKEDKKNFEYFSTSLSSESEEEINADLISRNKIVYYNKQKFFEKLSKWNLGKWFNRGLKYGLALSLLSILPINSFNEYPPQNEVHKTPKLTPKVMNVDYEISYNKKINVRKGLLSAIQSITGLRGKKLIEKNEEIVNYNITNHPNKLVRERIGYDLCKFENGKKVMEEDGIKGDYIPDEYVLYPAKENASKSLIVLVNENGEAVVNGKTLSIDDYIKRSIPENAVIKEFKYDEEKHNLNLVEAYNAYGIKKAREISRLNNDEIYSRLNDSRKQGSIVKYSSNLINSISLEDKYKFWRDTTSIYLNGKTIEDSLKQIEEETGIKMSKSTMYRGITKYTEEINMPKKFQRKSIYMKSNSYS